MKCYKLTLLTLLLPSLALAQAQQTAAVTPPELPNALLEAAARGERKVKAQRAAPAEPQVEAPVALGASKVTRPQPQNLDQVLLSLVDEVEALKSKVVVTSRMHAATQTPKEKKNIGTRTVYTFQDGSIYEVHAGVDRVTDIELGAGEYLTNSPVAGDTVRWKLSVLESERGNSKSTHVIVKPIEENIETNLILTTNKNVYHLRLRASDWYMPAISWQYPDEEVKLLESARLKKRAQEKVAVSPEKLNFNYEVEAASYAWRPSQVFDDGEKTYIKMPPEISTLEAPALFLLDRDDEPMLVNYRVKGQFYIVDRIFVRAQMRVGKKEKIEITSDRDDRSFFEKLF